MRGGGGAGVAVSPSGRLEIVGLCSDDSAGGASLPRTGGLRCCELLPSISGLDDDDGAGAGFDDAVAGGGLGGVAGAGGGDEVVGGGGGGAALALSAGAGGVDGGGGGDEDGAEESVAELAGVFEELGVLRAGGAGGGTVPATSPARRLSALYCALLRSEARLFTSLSRSTPLSCVSGGGGTLPRLGKGSLLPSSRFCSFWPLPRLSFLETPVTSRYQETGLTASGTFEHPDTPTSVMPKITRPNLFRTTTYSI